MDFIQHDRWISVAVGVATGVGAFVAGMLSAAKTLLEIGEKRLDIRKKKRELEQFDERIAAPTEDHIGKYGGDRYRQIARKAHAAITHQEHLESKSFISDSTEESWKDDSSTR